MISVVLSLLLTVSLVLAIIGLARPGDLAAGEDRRVGLTCRFFRIGSARKQPRSKYLNSIVPVGS